MEEIPQAEEMWLWPLSTAPQRHHLLPLSHSLSPCLYTQLQRSPIQPRNDRSHGRRFPTPRRRDSTKMEASQRRGALVRAAGPSDLDLRRYIIHYGEKAQATYDAFNSEKASKFAGSCRYAKANLFSRVGLEKNHPFRYLITKYLYATSTVLLPDAFILKPSVPEAWSAESNWIGYVAVATEEGKAVLGRRDILIAWRGTVRDLEWVKDLQFGQVSAPEIFGGDDGVKIHSGWHSIYTSKNPRSTITGHSLGAAISTINAVDIVGNGYSKSAAVTAFLFASPRVGNDKFRQLFTSLENLRILRVRNAMDIVPAYPPLFYADVGDEMVVDSENSTYLKKPGNFSRWHNLEVYLHAVAGDQGSAADFRLKVARGITLVNKHTDALKDEYGVPDSWWGEKNKGMVQKEDGSWELMDHEDDDF